MDTPVFKTKPRGYVGQNPAGLEWWQESKAKAERYAKRIEEGFQVKDKRQLMLPGVK